ncbi:MAG: CHY zinc finger protein [Bacteroidota bacterium]|nr:CHY zinc finger protein [Bacteroidota bacterium]
MDIKGKLVDEQTRCLHYHSSSDVIAIKFKCCNTYYACIYCHTEEADHLSEIWKKIEFDTKAIFCGVCKYEMTINEYLRSDNECPFCSAKFNPECKKHYHFYFEI